MASKLTEKLYFSAGLGAPRSPGCGVSDSVQAWMDEVRYSGEKTELPPQIITKPLNLPVDDDESLGPQYKYSEEANDPVKSRVKRSALPNPNSKKSCALYIQTDPLFWKHIKEQVRALIDRRFYNKCFLPCVIIFTSEHENRGFIHK